MPNGLTLQPGDDSSSKDIEEILRSYKTIAVVGLSPKESRDSHKVARYLLEQGYEIVPVNPGQKEILGKPCFQSLLDIPFQVDVANLFLGPARIPSAVDQAIQIGVHAIWMQIGVVDKESAQKARDAGIPVVMDRCIMQEHRKRIITLSAP
ncbi:MAG: CoA-binding protein [Desulfatiglans sp.]|jgi:predicted CoA-binding protein|nr:CoA-binding protein [Thermodesulfobacteriota bacterium]MEE4353834.1 CoA-binding protein [Desulfatiglans sp.]